MHHSLKLSMIVETSSLLLPLNTDWYKSGGWAERTGGSKCRSWVGAQLCSAWLQQQLCIPQSAPATKRRGGVCKSLLVLMGREGKRLLLGYGPLKALKAFSGGRCFLCATLGVTAGWGEAEGECYR